MLIVSSGTGLGTSFVQTLDSGGGVSTSPNVSNVGSIGGIGGVSDVSSPPVTIFHGYIEQIEGVPVFLFPPGDVNGDMRVTGADSLLINQVLVGLRLSNSAVFQTTSFANGDVNQNGSVSGADSLVINQSVVGLRAFVSTKVSPNARTNIAVTPVTIYGIGFPTNGTVTALRFGPPVNLSLSNFVVHSRERITAVVPAGGGAGTGTVEVIAVSTNGVISFGRFINR